MAMFIHLLGIQCGFERYDNKIRKKNAWAVDKYALCHSLTTTDDELQIISESRDIFNQPK